MVNTSEEILNVSSARS